MKNEGSSLAVIDLGGQYCHLISRRLRDLNVWADVVNSDEPLQNLSRYAGLILSGGPRSVTEKNAPTVDRKVLDLGIPVLGICYGHQLIAHLLGGDVKKGKTEYGPVTLSILDKEELFEGADSSIKVWMSHADNVRRLPSGLKSLAKTSRCENAAYGDAERKIFGVQFHPEVVHSEFGSKLLSNFARQICRIRSKDEIKNQKDRLIELIKERVGDNSVFFFVSGGVDSTVAFTLCAQALPKDRLLGVYVDTGLMRKGETEEFQALLSSLDLGDRLRIRDAKERFLTALAGVDEPEKKRQIIGRKFVEEQEAAMKEYGIDESHWLLGQGTIYPDTIESGGKSGKAAVIKTHHNRCEEIQRLLEKGRVIEPLAEFYKDEVRHLGEALGLDRLLTQRWPFPGPGLAIRCLCNPNQQPSAATPIQLPKRFNDYKAISTAISAVGVQGDSRTYRRTAAVKGPFDYDKLQDIGSLLCHGKRHNRAIYLILARSPNFENAQTKPNVFIEAARLDLLREADFIARQVMEERGLLESVWQFPVVDIPLSIENDGESVVLRPVNSTDGMTANFARLNEPVLREIAESIVAKLAGVDAVFLDITDKPPATIEWE